MKLRYYLAGAMAFAASGCADQKFVGRPGLEVVSNSALPAPDRSDLIAPQRPYLIGPFDKLSVEVYGLPDLTRTVQADASGRVSLPLAGDLEAAGKTPGELAKEITARLRGQYIRDPQVTVNLTETISQLVTVEGEVKMPGLYPVVGSMTLIRAVAKAQGTTEFAKDEMVVVMRRVNGQDMAALYDLRAIRLGMYPDPEIYANDVILVGESRARRIFQSIVQASPLLTAPIIALLR